MKVLHSESIVEIPLYASVLKARRVRMGFKQEEIADKLGVSSMGLSLFENGLRIPKVQQLEKWANALGAELKIEIINLN